MTAAHLRQRATFGIAARRGPATFLGTYFKTITSGVNEMGRLTKICLLAIPGYLIVAALFIILWPAIQAGPEMRARARYLAEMQLLGQAMRNYSEGRDGMIYPLTLSDLEEHLVPVTVSDKVVTVESLSQLSGKYVYIRPREDGGAIDASTLPMIVQLPFSETVGMVYIMYADTHIEWVPTDVAVAALSAALEN